MKSWYVGSYISASTSRSSTLGHSLSQLTSSSGLAFCMPHTPQPHTRQHHALIHDARARVKRERTSLHTRKPSHASSCRIIKLTAGNCPSHVTETPQSTQMPAHIRLWPSKVRRRLRGPSKVRRRLRGSSKVRRRLRGSSLAHAPHDQGAIHSAHYSA